MKELSFSEKLKVLVDVSSSSGICIASIFLIIFMAFIFLTTTKKNAKKSKKMYLVVYAGLIGILLLIYHESLQDMFDYMMNNFFIVFYFPNLAIYLAAIITANIILFTTIFNFREDKLLKVINVLFYSIIHYLMILILNIVTTNELNVFDQQSVYSNNNALALISLTSTIFIVWIFFLIVYKIIRRKQKIDSLPVKEVIKYKKFIPSNIIEISFPKEAYMKDKIVEKDNTLIDFYQNQNSQLQDNYNNLLIEKENLLADKNQISQEKEQLLQDNNRITLEKQQVLEDMNKLSKEKEQLLQDNNRITLEKQQVLEDMNKLSFENNKLISEKNNILQDRDRILVEKNKMLEEKDEILKENNKYLELKKFDNMLTIDDYKIVLDLLKNKDKIQKEQEASRIEFHPYVATRVKDENIEENVPLTKLDELLNLS